YLSFKHCVFNGTLYFSNQIRVLLALQKIFSVNIYLLREKHVDFSLGNLGTPTTSLGNMIVSPLLENNNDINHTTGKCAARFAVIMMACIILHNMISFVDAHHRDSFHQWMLLGSDNI
ncbi:hypothetical protein ACJX0J_038315, partial [Zea mays]